MPTPKGRAALQKRQKERADLKHQDIIWIGIAASEFNIQRIGWLLLLADWPKVEIEKYEDQLAGIIPMDGEAELTPMEIDFALVRKDVIGELGRLAKAGKTDEAKQALQRHGGDTLVAVPQSNWLALLADLKEIK